MIRTNGGIFLEQDEIVRLETKISIPNLPAGVYVFRNKPEAVQLNWGPAIKSGYVVLREASKEEKTAWLRARDGDYIPTIVLRQLLSYKGEI